MLHRKFVLGLGQQWTCWHLQNICLSLLTTAASLWQGNSLATFYYPFAFVPHDMSENPNLPGLYLCTSLEVKLLQNEKFSGTEFFWCKNFSVLSITAWSSTVTTYVSTSFQWFLVHRLLQNCKKWYFTLLSHPKSHLEVLFHSLNAVLNASNGQEPASCTHRNMYQ